MTPVERLLRRIFLQPIDAAESRERRLQAMENRVASATRTFENAVTRFRDSADRLQEAVEQVVEANTRPHHPPDGS